MAFQEGQGPGPGQLRLGRVVNLGPGGIEEAVGLPVYAFPKEEEYFVELRLPAQASQGAPHGLD